MGRPTIETVDNNQRAIDIHNELSSNAYPLAWCIWFINEWENTVKTIRGCKEIREKVRSV